MKGTFRTLENHEEYESFKKWARENYAPYGEISGVWHPVVQLECALMNMEASEYRPNDADSFTVSA